MSRCIPPEIIREERIERLMQTHPHMITLRVGPVEYNHLTRMIGDRHDVEIIGDAIVGRQQIALELACTDPEIAERLLDAY